jgi:lipid II:glycine glycyltransferase (peptidoglycan interpeptide bridge formation enzyme)
MKVSEPAMAYSANSLQQLKDKLIATIDASSDTKTLEQCLELLHASDNGMPCVFTDEEFEEELRLSEESGYASEQDLKRCFGKWQL